METRETLHQYLRFSTCVWSPSSSPSSAFKAAYNEKTIFKSGEIH